VTAAAQRIALDVRDAGTGLVRLARFDPDWSDCFDASTSGFLRSFAGPLLAVIPYIAVAAVLMRASPEGLATGSDRLMWQAAIGMVTDAIAYPLLMAVAARAFGFGAGFGAFVVVVNWSQLFVSMLLACVAPLVLLGPGGYTAFKVAWLVLSMLGLFFTWRAARQTLSPDIAPAMLALVLSVAVSIVADQVAVTLAPPAPPSVGLTTA
jgi:hypothetical protein